MHMCQVKLNMRALWPRTSLTQAYKGHRNDDDSGIAFACLLSILLEMP